MNHTSTDQVFRLSLFLVAFPKRFNAWNSNLVTSAMWFIPLFSKESCGHRHHPSKAGEKCEALFAADATLQTKDVHKINWWRKWEKQTASGPVQSHSLPPTTAIRRMWDSSHPCEPAAKRVEGGRAQKLIFCVPLGSSTSLDEEPSKVHLWWLADLVGQVKIHSASIPSHFTPMSTLEGEGKLSEWCNNTPDDDDDDEDCAMPDGALMVMMMRTEMNLKNLWRGNNKSKTKRKTSSARQCVAGAVFCPVASDAVSFDDWLGFLLDRKVRAAVRLR